MASDEYIEAAKQENRQPTVFMQVEQADSDVLYYTTQADWEGSDTLTDVTTTEELGSVTQELFNSAAPDYELYTPFIGYRLASVPFNSFLNNLEAVVGWLSAQGAEPFLRFGVCNGDPNTPTNILWVQEVGKIKRVGRTGIGNLVSFSAKTVFNLRDETELVATDELFIYGEVSADNSTWFPIALSLIDGQGSVDLVKPTSQVITSEMDFGAVTASNPIFSVDDVAEAGASIAYSYEFSTDDITYTPGGSIVDGDSLTASRYFKIQADFTTTTGGRGKIREIQLSEGAFRFYGTHIDEPFAGVLPYLKRNSISSLNQKIKIGDGLSTTGESSVELLWTDDTADLIASGYLKGQDVAIFSGFRGLATDSYEPVITGTWYDHDLDEVNRVIKVKIRDALKQFEKRKLPEETVNNTDGTITNRTLTYTTTSLVTVMLDIFDKIGLRDRYISPDFADLEAGDYAANKYKVSRVIPKPTDSNELLDELSVTGSMYLIPLGNGQIKPKPFDINQASVDTIDVNDNGTFVNLKGNIKDFFSRFNAYYNPDTALTDEPSKSEDFDNGYGQIDAQAELRWFPEKGLKQHLDMWKVGRTSASTPLTVPPQALIDLVVLWNALFTEPLYTVTARDLPPRFADIEPADVIDIDNLDLPVVQDAWNGGAVYSGDSLDTSSEDTAPRDMFMSSDGAKLYVVGFTGLNVYQYSMLRSFDITTATYDSVAFSISSEVGSPTAIFFKPDGEKMYILDGNSNEIYQYSLSPAWDLSTASYDTVSLSVATQENNPQGMFFRVDGSSVYIVGTQNDTVYQYDMTTGWDLSTGSYASISKSISAQEAIPTALYFNANGSKMYIGSGSSTSIFEYDLSISNDITSAIYNNVSFSVTGGASSIQDMFFLDAGDSFFVTDTIAGEVFKYDLSLPFALSGETYAEGDRVVHDGRMWRSRVDGNTGNDPTSEAAFWQDTEILDSGLTDNKRFFVLGRKFNPNTALIDLDLMEMPPGTIGAFSSAFSSAFDV